MSSSSSTIRRMGFSEIIIGQRMKVLGYKPRVLKNREKLDENILLPANTLVAGRKRRRALENTHEIHNQKTLWRSGNGIGICLASFANGDHLGILQKLLQRWDHERGEMGQGAFDELEILASNLRERHVGIVDGHGIAFINQPFAERNARAFTQVIRARFKAQPKNTDLFFAGLFNH